MTTKERFMDWLDEFWPLVVIIAGILALLAILIWVAVIDERQWAAYSVEHHCVAVGKKAGQWVTTSNGEGGVSSDQTVYRCDGWEIQSQPRVAVAKTMISRLDVFRTPKQQVLTLVHTPSVDGNVLVFLNGLLLLADEDYTLAGPQLTFTRQRIGDAPIVQVQYWTAQ